MLERVLYAGLAAEDCVGALSRYLDALPHGQSEHAVRVYGEHIFVFARHDGGQTWCLMTVYLLPPAHRPAAHRAQRQHLALAA
jgi:hypothetical protein